MYSKGTCANCTTYCRAGFVDDCVGVRGTDLALQSLMDKVYNYSKLCHFEANVNYTIMRGQIKGTMYI